MKLAQTVRLGAWFLIALNLLMALGSIWVFIRMAPAIEVIIEQNARSLHASEEMLSSLAMSGQNESENRQLIKTFSEALRSAQGNITETGEPFALEAIGENYLNAFSGDLNARKLTVSSIARLSELNRAAMERADRKARQLGNAGAWGVVFMAAAVFMVGMLFMRSLKKSLVKPLEEIHSVITACISGETMRRCTGPDMPKDIKMVFNGVNELLDKCSLNAGNNNK